jgi:hypothetical protein
MHGFRLISGFYPDFDPNMNDTKKIQQKAIELTQNTPGLHKKKKKNVFSNFGRHLKILTSSMLAMSSQTGVNVIKLFFLVIEFAAK